MKGVINHMIYYRVALQSEHSSSWQWRSSTLTSVSSVFDILEVYAHIPKTAIRIFFSSSSVYMDEMLARANDGLVANFVTTEQFLQGWHMVSADVKRLELELGIEGDHDCPYTFMLPDNMPQILAWTKLLARVHSGALKP
jgi:hypothetical protein